MRDRVHLPRGCKDRVIRGNPFLTHRSEGASSSSPEGVHEMQTLRLPQTDCVKVPDSVFQQAVFHNHQSNTDTWLKCECLYLAQTPQDLARKTFNLLNQTVMYVCVCVCMYSYFTLHDPIYILKCWLYFKIVGPLVQIGRSMLVLLLFRMAR